MLIETIELENVGPFRERLTLGPLDRGLNVLAERNEWGKSTVLRALTRAFFDKYSSQGQEIKALQPAGSSLAPRISVAFCAAGVRYRLQKVFLEKKSSQLFRASGEEWERTAESDRADQRVRELLGAPKLEGRAVKPETWGLLRYLWARQDDPCDWPEWDCAGGEEARRCLATVPLDPQVRALVCALRNAVEPIFTSTGRPKQNGPMQLAEQRCENLEAELAAVRAKRAETETLQHDYKALAADVAVLESERTQLQADALTARTEAETAEKLQAQLVTLEAAYQQANTALQQIKADELALAEIACAAAALIAEQQESHARAAQLAQELPRLEAAVQRAQEEQRSRVQGRISQQERVERVRALLRVRQLRDELAKLRTRAEAAECAAKKVEEIEQQRAQLSVVTHRQLQRWRKMASELLQTTTQLETLGLQVTLTPARAAELQVMRDGAAEALSLGAGESHTLRAARGLVLELAGWGRLEIASGATEVRELETTRRKLEKQLQEELATAGVASISAAEVQFSQRQELDRQLAAGRAALQLQLIDLQDLAALRAAVEQARRSHDQQSATLQATEEESGLSVTALEAEVQTLTASIRAAGQAEKELASRVEEERERLESSRRRRGQARAQHEQLATKHAGLIAQQQSLTSRYGGDLAAAIERARSAFVQAEARLADARRQLPPNAEKLPERSRRAAKAAEEVQLALEAKRQQMQRCEVLLEQHGAEGLYSRENAAEEALELARSEAERIRREGWALRLAAELIERREQSAIQTVLGPLEDRLSAVFAELTGRGDRRVFFDEHLAVRGIGRREDELIPFTDLSRGAREQLLLALRAAIALELAKKEPPCLILDDVLVHTDPMRQRNVLDYLQTLSGQVQIVILTCHAERYRGVGKMIATS